MKKVLSVILVVVFMMAMSGCGGESEQSAANPVTDAAVKAYVGAVDEAYAYEVTEKLAYDEELVSGAHQWRTAGSKEEHAAADYLEAEMKEIGLVDVEKAEVKLDLWQFNDATLTLEGTDIEIKPASYANNGTDADGITAEIVDAGTGFAEDYDGLDVKGKIVLVGVDQWNEAWIDQYTNEAKLHGAAAIVTYDVDGYATYSDDVINMQDMCTGCDIMPCVSISKSNYNELAAAIEKGNTNATLVVDNVVKEDAGTGYNVVGKIKGKSSDQQIILAGHYDKYFYGFQDDCAAVGLFMGIAKGMIDSNYVPENDIVFVAHCAEEWGTVGSQFDWATGSWEMINTAHPEWADKTIAVLNFELPAYYDDAEEYMVSSVPELQKVKEYLIDESGLIEAPAGDVFPKGISSEALETGCWDDNICYRFAGIPTITNFGGSQDGADGWRQQRYHTAADDKDTYNADVMTTSLNTYGAIAIYLDNAPALEVDFTATADKMEEILDEELSEAAGADAESYTAAIAALREAGEAYNAKIADINDRYDALVAEGADESEIEAVRAEGKELNKQTLEAFKFVQDNFVNLILTTEMGMGHQYYLDNAATISEVVDALEAGKAFYTDDEDGALDIAWAIDGENEYGYYLFSPETTERVLDNLLEERNPGNLFWGTGKGSVMAGTSEATLSLLERSEDEEDNGDFTKEIGIYKSALESQLKLMAEKMADETAAMNQLAEMISK